MSLPHILLAIADLQSPFCSLDFVGSSSIFTKIKKIKKIKRCGKDEEEEKKLGIWW
jgi:hypothetical protein